VIFHTVFCTSISYCNIDPEKAKEAQKKLQELEDKQLLDAGKVEDLLNLRTERMKADYQNQLVAFIKTISELKKALKVANQSMAEVLIDSSIRATAMKAGVLEHAVEDMVLRGQRSWTLKDKTPTAMKGWIVQTSCITIGSRFRGVAQLSIWKCYVNLDPAAATPRNPRPITTGILCQIDVSGNGIFSHFCRKQRGWSLLLNKSHARIHHVPVLRGQSAAVWMGGRGNRESCEWPREDE
jgi:hypothetical protein